MSKGSCAEIETPEQRKECSIAKDAAKEAAKEAIKAVFAILGVDVDKPEQVEDFRKSLRFGDGMRRAADKGQIAFVVCLVGLLFAAFTTGIKFNLGSGGP